MPHVAPLDPHAMPETLRPILAMAEASMGFVPNSMATMAHWPELAASFAPLAGTVMGGGKLDRGLKQMIAAVVSGAAGCRYCQAHTTHGAAHGGGIDEAKIAQVWDYARCDLFTGAERAALDLALAAGQNPNRAAAEHFAALREHFSDREIVEIVAVIALFGFLNRWNDTLETRLEDAPAAFAASTFAQEQWEPGKHGA